MANKRTQFWLALLDYSYDQDLRARFWNGYLGWKLPSKIKGKKDPKGGWPQLCVDPPDGGWPELTEEEQKVIETLAARHGGHPDFEYRDYMDFSDHTFSGEIDLSGLILVTGNFSNATFKGGVILSHNTWFYADTSFRGAVFEKSMGCSKAWFDGPISFGGSYFKRGATFLGAKFMGGASFADVVFEWGVMFDDSRFEERYYSGGSTDNHLADFRNAKFRARTSFREVVFGNDESTYSRHIWPERRADFTDAEFMATTIFRGAVFGGVPAFFNATLHEDTDFGSVDWEKAETKNVPVDYAIRAWERLELMMHKLEKPLDRHRFFRLKMRARRRKDGRFLRTLNRLFEIFSDYGWSVERAFLSWLGHWFGFAIVLLVNTGAALFTIDWWKLAVAALGTGFANGHPFLGLATDGGYLAEGRQLLECNDGWGLLTMVGTVEAVLGPTFLFLLLLTLRNRFRLA